MKLKKESGFTLVEVIICLLISTIFAVGLLGVSRLNQDLFRENRGALQTQQSVYFAMDFLVRELREARSVTTASNTELVFVNGNNNEIRYRINGNLLERSENGVDFQVVANNIQDNKGSISRFDYDANDFLLSINLRSEVNGREAILENRVRLRNAN